MKLSDFSYDLPEELIAQTPLQQRDASRLLVLDRKTGEYEDHTFGDVLDYFQAGDCLIVNDSRVIPARLQAKRPTGGAVEIFLLRPHAHDQWECLVKPGRNAREGQVLLLGDLTATVTEVLEDGNRVICFASENGGDVTEQLKKLGEVPLPPYIHEKLQDSERYQTVYSKAEGSVAAPTAGLHFTPELLEQLKAKGVNVGYVTLHVGLGTFRPVKVEDPTTHKMHSEYYILPQATADLINKTKAAGGRVTAVGTTATRVLETAGRKGLPLSAMSGETDIFIYPGFEFAVIDRLITHFHLPESTLIMLISAFSKREYVLNAYRHAVEEKYRFFSFGDAMFLK
ncbi:MAG: tRNA preQ1(34) S-adenosylmethionine ribosyltransferase-isomerase QueA [Clostridia bacterium]|nr:tRNA preQ1(34) S-adenosylmethionine ribosyltransferase-isomerase QueA [Clostridia bacterium]